MCLINEPKILLLLLLIYTVNYFCYEVWNKIL